MTDIFVQHAHENKEQLMARVGKWMDLLSPAGDKHPSVIRIDYSMENTIVVSVFSVTPNARSPST